MPEPRQACQTPPRRQTHPGGHHEEWSGEYACAVWRRAAAVSPHRACGTGGTELRAPDRHGLRGPVPLLLTRGKPWEGAPPVAAALDVSGADSPELARTILLAANDISQICGGSLEVVYASRFEAAPPDAPQAARILLASRAAAADVQARAVHVVIGDPVTAIPEFVARHSYEMLVLGALTHRHSMTALLGTLTGRLIETVGCDLLLVRASPEAAAAELSAA